MGKRLLFVSAGDPSGDNATSHLITSLRSHTPELELDGLGGPKLKALGQHQLADHHDLAVLGFWEVAKHYFFFKRLLTDCADQIRQRKPACILLVDYPGFNLRLAEKVKPLGIPIVYYISPQVWAWHKKRVHQIKRLVDLMILILPFEQEFYDQYQVPHKLAGHYLLDDIPSEYVRSELPDNNQIALLPGSRPQEIHRMFPSMLETARMMHREHGTTAVVAGIKGAYDYDSLLTESDSDRIEVAYGDSRKVVHDSRLVLTASGTATLETGIIGRPMVVVYKTGWLTYQIAKRLVKLDKIALVNLVLGEKLVPELIQNQASPRGMFSEMTRLLGDDSYRERVCRALHRVPDLLGGKGASERAAQMVGEYL